MGNVGVPPFKDFGTCIEIPAGNLFDGTGTGVFVDLISRREDGFARIVEFKQDCALATRGRAVRIKVWARVSNFEWILLAIPVIGAFARIGEAVIDGLTDIPVGRGGRIIAVVSKKIAVRDGQRDFIRPIWGTVWVSRNIGRNAGKSFFDFARRAAAVAGNEVAVVTFLAGLLEGQAVAAGGAACNAGAFKNGLDLANRAAAVAGDGVSVVTGLAFVEDAVAA